MPSFNSSLGKQLKYYLKKHDLNQTELADLLGVTHGTVSLWVNGKYTPRANQIDQMCKLFHCTQADLLGNAKNSTYQVMFDNLKPWQQEAIIDQMKDYDRRNREEQAEEKRRTSAS